MKSVELDKNIHDRKRFDCGIDALNNYLRTVANQQSSKDNSRTYILEDETNSKHIIGFYSLTMTNMDFSKLPSTLQKKHPSTYVAALVARLAVDRRYKNRGIGSWLLIDALKKLLLASDVVAFPIVVVDAKDGVCEFYKEFGFRAFEDDENRLFITVADIRATFSKV